MILITPDPINNTFTLKKKDIPTAPSNTPEPILNNEITHSSSPNQTLLPLLNSSPKTPTSLPPTNDIRNTNNPSNYTNNATHADLHHISHTQSHSHSSLENIRITSPPNLSKSGNLSNSITSSPILSPNTEVPIPLSKHKPLNITRSSSPLTISDSSMTNEETDTTPNKYNDQISEICPTSPNSKND